MFQRLIRQEIPLFGRFSTRRTLLHHRQRPAHAIRAKRVMTSSKAHRHLVEITADPTPHARVEIALRTRGPRLGDVGVRRSSAHVDASIERRTHARARRRCDARIGGSTRPDSSRVAPPFPSRPKLTHSFRGVTVGEVLVIFCKTCVHSGKARLNTSVRSPRACGSRRTCVSTRGCSSIGRARA